MYITWATYFTACIHFILFCIRCARFLLHFKHHAEEYSSHIRPQTSYAYSLEQSSQRQSASLVKPHSAVSRSTPTPHNRGKNAFEQISVKLEGTSLPEKQPLLPDVTRKHVRKTSVSDTRLPKKEIQPETTTIRASVSDQQLAGAAKLPDMATTHLPSYKPTTDHQRAPSHTNRTLRYMVRHFPQVSSRASSAMVFHILYFTFISLYFFFISCISLLFPCIS